jgi:hypothetical protein
VTPPKAEAEAEAQGRARRRPSPEAEVVAEAWGRARQSSLLCLRLDSEEVMTCCCQSFLDGWHSCRSG